MNCGDWLLNTLMATSNPLSQQRIEELRAPSTHHFKAGSNDHFWHMTSKIDGNSG